MLINSSHLVDHLRVLAANISEFSSGGHFQKLLFDILVTEMAAVSQLRARKGHERGS